MVNTVDFFVDGKSFSARKASQSVADILAIAGFSSEQFFLISQGGTNYLDPHQNITIRSGDHFEIKKRGRTPKPSPAKVIRYKINGEPQTTSNATLSVEQILKMAGKAASIDPNQLNTYILENIGTGKKYHDLGDIIEIANDDEFLAVHAGRTPVAFLPAP